MLLDLSKSYTKGIWALQGPDGYIFLIATKNLVKYLTNVLYSIEVGDRNIDPLFVTHFKSGVMKLVLVEDCGFEDSMSLNMRLGVIQRNMIGTKWYSHQKLGTKWTVVVKPIRIDRYPYVGVFLKPSNSNAISNLTMVGLFNTKKDALEWKELYYPKIFVERVVFALNDSTQEYHTNDQ